MHPTHSLLKVDVSGLLLVKISCSLTLVSDLLP